MRTFRFILLLISALLSVAAVILLIVDGNLSRLIGQKTFDSGERLFPYTKDEVSAASWMRINHVGEIAEFQRLPNGVWWGIKPWNDRMDPRAAAAILQFTHSTGIVYALPLHKIDKASLKEFGVKTTPITITLKSPNEDGSRLSTMARFTLGSLAPWQVDSDDGKVTNDTTYMQSDFYGRDKRVLVGTGNILPLFKSGIRQLRDHRPLLLHPDLPARIEINHLGEHIKLYRETPKSPWKITSPLAVDADPEMMSVLLGTLQKLTALRVTDPEETSVPDVSQKDLTSISITNFSSKLKADGKTFSVENTPVTLKIYPPSNKTNPNENVKATVSDRKAVFELAQIMDKSIANIPGVRNIPLSFNLLRSKQLTDIGDYKITGVSIRRGFLTDPIVARFIPGDEEKGREARWLYTAEDSRYEDVNPDQLIAVLKTIKEGKVTGFASDNATDLSIFGLNSPELTLTMSLLPKPNEEAHPPVMVFFARGEDGSWYAQQAGKPSIVQVSNEFMRPILANSLAWKKKNLFTFSKFDLTELHLEHVGHGAPLILKFDRLDDTWTASKGGKDETLNINPNRANRYLSEIEKLQALTWLPYDHSGAQAALKNPVFRLKMVFNVTKDILEPTEVSEDGLSFADLPSTEQKIIQLEIAPAGQAGYSRFYYGRTNTSPNYFILNMDAVRLLGASLAEDN